MHLPCLRPLLLVQALRATCQFPCTTGSKSLPLRLLLRKWAALCDLPQEISSKRRDEGSGISRTCGQSVSPRTGGDALPCPLCLRSLPSTSSRAKDWAGPAWKQTSPVSSARSSLSTRMCFFPGGEGKVARPQPLPGRIRERRWYPSRSQGGSEVSVHGIGERKQKELGRTRSWWRRKVRETLGVGPRGGAYPS